MATWSFTGPAPCGLFDQHVPGIYDWWATITGGQPGNYVVMQNDRNLLMYRPSGYATTTFDGLLGELEAAGLRRGIPGGRQIVSSTLTNEDNAVWFGGRLWRADGEDLAEGDVEMWLTEMIGALAQSGVRLEVATVRRPLEEQSSGYTVRINGRDILLYDYDPNENDLPATEDPWMDRTVMSAPAINRLLEAAGSDCRVALFWPGGTDGISLLARKAVLAAMDNHSGDVGPVIP